jgi:hypothetical protein
VSDNKELDTKRARGSLIAALDQRLSKREALVRDLVAEDAAITDLWEKLCAREQALPRSEPRTVPPGRRTDVTVRVVSLLPEHPPRSHIFAPLVAATERETADRARRAGQEAAEVRRSGLTRLPAEGPTPVHGI